jgi:cell division protein ZapA (FtsZ GTPase activity inhibitor)
MQNSEQAVAKIGDEGSDDRAGTRRQSVSDQKGQTPKQSRKVNASIRRSAESNPASVTDDDSSVFSATDIENTVKQAAEAMDREINELLKRPLDPDQMIGTITMYLGRANTFAGQAETLRILGRLNRWGTGRVLLLVKAALKHGQFEEWLGRHREALGFGKSSAENFMKLARDYPAAGRFLEEELPLREMYGRDADSEDDDSTTTQESKDPNTRVAGCPSKTEALLKILTTVQKQLRHVSESDQRPDDDQLRQLKLVKTELDRFFEKIFNQPQSHE